MEQNTLVNCKQVIVLRKDLGMRKGKMVSQGAHASLGALLTMFTKDKANDKFTNYLLTYKNSGDDMDKENKILSSWLDGIFTKICLCVDNEDELVSLYNNIKKEAPEIPIVMIEDNGLTEFHGVKTKTCIGIGPWVSEEIDKFTKHLKLL